eukprot:TRINITY_DN25454_c0_g1_i1.p1 TRINITY_DN25454_c0_g1~~TRINITY_DN25454_c0_g1_i1.p1  ORF type:complete len:1508 (+),score=201.68 TRINITY_DN25454_c0_g1_i1:559-4524(+)
MDECGDQTPNHELLVGALREIVSHAPAGCSRSRSSGTRCHSTNSLASFGPSGAVFVSDRTELATDTQEEIASRHSSRMSTCLATDVTAETQPVFPCPENPTDQKQVQPHAASAVEAQLMASDVTHEVDSMEKGFLLPADGELEAAAELLQRNSSEQVLLSRGYSRSSVDQLVAEERPLPEFPGILHSRPLVSADVLGASAKYERNVVPSESSEMQSQTNVTFASPLPHRKLSVASPPETPHTDSKLSAGSCLSPQLKQVSGPAEGDPECPPDVPHTVRTPESFLKRGPFVSPKLLDEVPETAEADHVAKTSEESERGKPEAEANRVEGDAREDSSGAMLSPTLEPELEDMSCASAATLPNQPRFSSGPPQSSDKRGESLPSHHAKASSTTPTNESVTISGVLWKRQSKVSRATKIWALLQKEAEDMLSLKNIQVGRVVKLARQVVGLVGQDRRPSVVDPKSMEHVVARHESMASTPRTESVALGDNPPSGECDEQGPHGDVVVDGSKFGASSSLFDEAVWGRRRVWLCGSILKWAKEGEEHGLRGRHQEMGPLWGSSVELLGSREEGRHVLCLFPTPQVRRRGPLALAAASAADAERWVEALRAACEFPSPPPPLRSRCISKVVEFCLGRGPPPGFEPPCAQLRLEILSAFGLRVSRLRRNTFVLATLGNRQMRTATRYQTSGEAVFGQSFTVPVEFEEADAALQLEVFHEPEYEDHDSELVGAISMPLWSFGRNRRVEMEVSLRLTKTTRNGVVNASLGYLLIAVTMIQPIGHLWLPAEPPSVSTQGQGASAPLVDAASAEKKQSSVNLVDLEMQIGRVDALLQLVILLQTKIVRVAQMEHKRRSLAWFIILQAWALLAWDWTLAILVAWALQVLLTFRNSPSPLPRPTHDWSSTSSVPQMSSNDAPRTQVTHEKEPSQIDTERRERADTALQIGRARNKTEYEIAGETGNEAVSGNPLDIMMWQVERRVVFAGFSSEYLSDFDPPTWQEDGKACSAPSTVMERDDVKYRYGWKVVVNPETDENGWQYAPSFRSTEWRRAYDAMTTWVRRRLHHGHCLGLVRQGMSGTLPSDAQDKVALGLQAATASTPTAEDVAQPGVGFQLEDVVSENRLFSRYIQMYLAIRNDVDYYLSTIEKLLNLFRWKDRTVTFVVAVVLTIAGVVAAIVPTRYVFSVVIDLCFYAGWLMGKAKRQRRDRLLNKLAGWSKSVCKQEILLHGGDSFDRLEECGITRLALRNWCNQTWRTAIDLRTVDNCTTLGELADLVASASPILNKAAPRYRAWHSDFYFNFLDHVPSDVTEHDIGSACYRTPAASSLPPVLA